MSQEFLWQKPKDYFKSPYFFQLFFISRAKFWEKTDSLFKFCEELNSSYEEDLQGLIKDLFDQAKEKEGDESKEKFDLVEKALFSVKKLEIEKTYPQTAVSEFFLKIIFEVESGRLAIDINSTLNPKNNTDIKQIKQIQKILKAVFIYTRSEAVPVISQSAKE